MKAAGQRWEGPRERGWKGEEGEAERKGDGRGRGGWRKKGSMSGELEAEADRKAERRQEQPREAEREEGRGSGAVRMETDMNNIHKRKYWGGRGVGAGGGKRRQKSCSRKCKQLVFTA